MNQLKQIPQNGEPFTANGKTYYQEDALSIDRWILMNELTIQLGFGVEYSELQKNIFNMIEMGNKQRFSDIVISAHNMVNGISKMYTRKPMILKFCALYMNTEDEDRGTINEDDISRKINDWKTEELGIDGFFVFSLLKARSLAENYQNAIQDVSEQMVKAFPTSNQTATNNE